MKYEYHSRYSAIVCTNCGFRHVIEDRTALGRAPASRHVDLVKLVCPRCRHEAKRKALPNFTPPSPEDAEAVTQITAQMKSLDDVFRELGEPDEVFTTDALPKTVYDVTPFSQQLIYRRRWPTLDLFVIERIDGSLMFFFVGKSTGPIGRSAP